MVIATKYPFVQAHYDYGIMKNDPLAFVIHMAEGGGTVSYLAREPARGVSVHFVIDYAGVITQMLKLDHISGSINPNALRNNNDAPFIGYNGELIRFGRTAGINVLGHWYTNPNNAIISVEIQGYASRGPSKIQREALLHLGRFLKKEIPTIVGNLGHRDFQSVKACPGKHINWASIGGHGRFVGN